MKPMNPRVKVILHESAHYVILCAIDRAAADGAAIHLGHGRGETLYTLSVPEGTAEWYWRKIHVAIAGPALESLLEELNFGVSSNCDGDWETVAECARRLNFDDDTVAWLRARIETLLLQGFDAVIHVARAALDAQEGHVRGRDESPAQAVH